MPRTPGRFPTRTFAPATTLRVVAAPPVVPPTAGRVCVTATTSTGTGLTVTVG